MSLTVVIEHKDPNQIMEIVQELRSQGYTQGKDFDFAYQQSQWDAMTGEIPKHTIFTFYTEKYATLFAIKYSS